MPRLVLLTLFAAVSAWGQSLVFHGVPATVRLAGRTDAVTVERLSATAQPVTTGSLVVLVTAPLGGQVAPGPEPFSTWGPTATVTIASGSSVSPPVYLRAGVRGPSSWTATGSGFSDAAALMGVRDDALTCDVETGTRLDTEVPPGPFNTLYAPWPGSTLTASASAAHRGAFGLRLVDADTNPGAAADTALYDDGAPLFGDFHARTWVRVVSSNGQGAAIIAQLTNAQATSPSLFDVKVRADLGLTIAGFGADAGYGEVIGDAGLTLGAWQLLEFSVTGVGSADGGLLLWLDGTLLLTRHPVDFSGTRMPVGRLAVGEPYAASRLFLGTIDFDDVRSAGVPLASRLEVRAAGDGGFVGECLPLEVQLRASFGDGLAATRESVPVRLDAGGDAELFVDTACAVAGDQVSMAPDASGVVLSFRPVQPSASVLATTPDFLPGVGLATVATPPALEVAPLLARVGPGEVVNFTVTGGTGRGVGFRMVVNPSGGAVDAAGRYVAGPVTGGFDVVQAHDSAGQTSLGTVEVIAAAVDAGIPDAGVPDAGVMEPTRVLGVGCGCGASAESSLALSLLLALAALRRRRRV